MTEPGVGACLPDDLVQALVQGSLPAEARAAGLAHLEVCRACRRLVVQLTAMAELEAEADAPAPMLASGPRTPGPEVRDLPVARGAFLGRYLVTGVAGAGAMGAVYAAHDPELDRSVAIKLMHSSMDDGDERLRREARVMARLVHPNVVRVYDVGEHDGRTFIAMELIDGRTLRRWLHEAPRSVAKISAAFLEAGRGLAAAHEAAVLHRDFKPDNVLVARDGRIVVGDFGLARHAGHAAPLPVPGPLQAGPTPIAMTRPGAVPGTPAYLAPELLSGAEATAASDQFAYCVSLWEALYGQRPFEAPTPELSAEAARARRALPTNAGRVPAALRRALLRGLSPTPEERFPSMTALLRELAQAARPSRRRLLSLGAAAVTVGAGLALWATGRADPCPPPTARVDAVWGSARRDALRARLVAVDPQHGAERFAAAATHLDAFAAGFRDQMVEACAATRKKGTQSDTLLDLRMRCLDRRFAELEASVGLLAAADGPPALDRAVSATTRLAPLSACADAEALSLWAPLPEEPQARARAEALLMRAGQLSVRERGDPKDLPAEARELVLQARALGLPGVLSAALAAQARVQRALGDNVAAAESLKELTLVAARARDDRGAAFAWTALVKVTGGDLLKPDQALELVPVAAAAVARAGNPVDLRVDLLLAEGAVLGPGPRGREALDRLEEARTMLRAARAGEPGSPLAQRQADVLLLIAEQRAALGDHTDAAAEYEGALAAIRAISGADSADEARVWSGLAQSLRAQGQLDRALEAIAHATQIREARVGPSMALALDSLTVGSLLGDARRWAEALPADEKALQLMRTFNEPDSPALLPALIARAQALAHVGRVQESARGYDEIIECIERGKLTSINLPITLHDRAQLETWLGHCDQALADDTRATALFEQQRPGDGSLALPLVGAARCLTLMGRPAQALPLLDRALALPPRADAAATLAQARFYQARARAETGADLATQLARAKAARAEAVAAGVDAKDLELMELWPRATR